LARYFVQKKYRFGVVFGQAANAVALILFTVIGFLVNMKHQTLIINLVGSIPSGISYVAVPKLGHISNILPVALTVVLVAIMEHIAVAKSFARVNGYKIKANQEICSIGWVNIAGSFLGGFPSTGMLNLNFKVHFVVAQ
jgi:sodium-independent sulfate anion transporter 11